MKTIIFLIAISFLLGGCVSLEETTPSDKKTNTLRPRVKDQSGNENRKSYPTESILKE